MKRIFKLIISIPLFVLLIPIDFIMLCADKELLGMELIDWATD